MQRIVNEIAKIVFFSLTEERTLSQSYNGQQIQTTTHIEKAAQIR